MGSKKPHLLLLAADIGSLILRTFLSQLDDLTADDRFTGLAFFLLPWSPFADYGIFSITDLEVFGC